MRVSLVGLMHETHSFANVTTTMDDFAAHQLYEGDSIVDTLSGSRTEAGGMIDAAKALNIQLVPGFLAMALPSGLVERKTAETLVERLLGQVRKAMPVDGVLVVLHGAMVADGYQDMEGHVLRKLRSLVGPHIPISVTLDLHANISEEMVQSADSIVGYDTYPHVDAYERGYEAAHILSAILRNELDPVMVLAKPPMMPSPQGVATQRSPMRELMAMAHEAEDLPEIVAVTVAGGYPFSDVPCAGLSVLVVANRSLESAQVHAERIARTAWDQRNAFGVTNTPVDEAVESAAKLPGPVVLVDVADNIGAGSPGDGTVLLDALLKADVPRSLVAIADKEAVAQAIGVGVGGRLDTTIGGKTDSLHGAPVRVEGRIRLLSEGIFRNKGTYMTGKQFSMGRTAVLETENRSVVVISERKCLPFDLAQFHSVGVDPQEFQVIVAKSAVAWRAAFGDIARHVIEVDTPGLCTANLDQFEFHHIPDSMYPFDPNAMWRE